MSPSPPLSPAHGRAQQLTPELQALVDGGVITPDQAQEAVRSSPTATQFTGLAQCLSDDCSLAQDARTHGRYRPIELRRETVEQRAPDLANMLISSMTYIVPVDDDDLACPECGAACAVLDHEPPNYPSMLKPAA